MAAEQKRGYQQLADLMVWDTNLVIFPRFCSVNMLCLLHRQAEISELEERLEDLGYVNNKSSDEKRRRLCYDWSVLKDLGSDSPENKLLYELRIKLAEYSKWKPDKLTFHIALSKSCFLHGQVVPIIETEDTRSGTLRSDYTSGSAITKSLRYVLPSIMASTSQRRGKRSSRLWLYDMVTRRRWRASHRRFRWSFTIRECRENGYPMDARCALANNAAPPEKRYAGKMLRQRVHYLPWRSRALIVPLL
jgi:hypothetical protein